MRRTRRREGREGKGRMDGSKEGWKMGRSEFANLRICEFANWDQSVEIEREPLRGIGDKKRSVKIRAICVIRVPFKPSDPNKSLQATAGRKGFLNINRQTTGFGLSDVCRLSPARLPARRLVVSIRRKRRLWSRRFRRILGVWGSLWNSPPRIGGPGGRAIS